MNTQEILFSVLICLMVIVAFLLGAEYLQIKKGGVECIKNPLVYGVRSIGDANNADVNCMCFFNKTNSPVIYVNKDNLSIGRGRSYG